MCQSSDRPAEKVPARRKRIDFALFPIVFTCLILLSGVASAFSGISEVTTSKTRILLNGQDQLMKGFIFQTFVEVCRGT